MRTAPVVLTLLLVCAAAAGAAGTGGPGAVEATTPTAEQAPPEPVPTAVTAVANGTDVTNRTHVLSIPSENVTNARIDEARIDAGLAVGVEVNTSAERMETIALRQRITAAETNDERQRRVLDGMNELEKRVVTLRTEHRTAIEGYASGELGTRELLAELARIKAESDALERRLAVLEELASETEGSTLDSDRIPALAFQLRAFDGPVRDRALQASSGEAPPTRIYVAASEDGVVLSTVIDGQYVREVYRGDLRSLQSGTVAMAENVTARSYPAIWAASTNPSGTGSGSTHIVDVPYATGNLTAFVDGGSERVFKEYQRIRLANVTGGEVRERTIDLTVRVNRTYAGGPLRIEVLDPGTGDPIDASVRIAAGNEGSVDVGTTGEDGVLWTVAPRGTFVVTAIQEGSNDLSTVEITSTEPVSVAEAYGSNDSGDD
ncbi:DUF7096 domain-containing protein [Halorarum halobium]|uniref:DUF7096 domain-containing protein n=1 Tax=Halorarum halobium TaxID=3075121 RepID=UPI0028AD534B|nr:hypothetical protein [Halobaculum sp. XH14]